LFTFLELHKFSKNAISAVGLLGRMYYVGRIPDGHQEKENIKMMDGITEAISK